MLRIVTNLTGKAGSPWVTTHFYEGGASSIDAQAAVDQETAIWDYLTSSMVAGVKINVEPFVAVVDPATGAVTGGFVTAPGDEMSGLSANPMLPAANQMLIRLRTGVYIGGRALMGKWYVPGVRNGVTGPDGSILPATALSLSGDLTVLLNSGPDLLVWSRKYGRTEAAASLDVDTDFAVLRSRRD